MNEFELFKQREADYSSEFEKLAKECFDSFNRLRPSPLDAQEDPYLAGYSEILNGAIESMKAFINENTLRKDYPKVFGEMRTKYYQMYLRLKKIPETDFNEGAFNAARDLYKGLDGVVESAAEFGLNQLQKHQQQRKSVRR